MADLTPVQAQLEAYNTGDIERFRSLLAVDVVLEDGGRRLMQSREGMRAEYVPFFAEYPDLHGEIRHRTNADDYVIDEELIHGWQAERVHAVATYHVANGLIDHVRLIDG